MLLKKCFFFQNKPEYFCMIFFFFLFFNFLFLFSFFFFFFLFLFSFSLFFFFILFLFSFSFSFFFFFHFLFSVIFFFFLFLLASCLTLFDLIKGHILRTIPKNSLKTFYHPTRIFTCKYIFQSCIKISIFTLHNFIFNTAYTNFFLS